MKESMVVMLRLFCFPPFHSRGDSILHMGGGERTSNSSSRRGGEG